jgi:hypothetical protein
MPDPGVTSGFVDRNGNPVASESSAELTTRFRAGDIGAMGPVPVRGTDGVIRNVAPEELESQVNAGALIVSPATVAEEERLARREEEYGGIGGAITSLAQGAASSASFGTSPLALEAAGVPLENQRDVREEQPFAYGVGQLVGTLPAAFAATASGGSAPAVALGARVGLGTIGRTVATEALTGALFGAGDAINEANINNRPLAAESILASAAIGGTAGALIGRVMGGSAARAEANSAIREAAGDLAAVEAEAVERAMATGATPAEAQALATKAKEDAVEAFSAMTLETRSVVERLRDSLVSFGERSATRAVGVDSNAQRFMRSELRRNAADPLEEVGRFILNKGIVVGGKDTQKEIAQRAIAEKAAAGSRLGAQVDDIIARYDGADIAETRALQSEYNTVAAELSSNPSATGQEVFRRFQREIEPFLYRDVEVPASQVQSGTKNVLDKATGEFVDAPVYTDVPSSVRREDALYDFRQLREKRAQVDKIIQEVRSSVEYNDPLIVNPLQKMRSAFEREETRMVRALGDDVRDAYEVAKREYQLASMVEEMANKAWSNAEKESPVSVAEVGNVMRWLGRANIPMALANVVSGAAQSFARRNRNTLSAVLGRKVSERSVNATVQAVEEQAQSAAAAMFRSARRASPRAAAYAFAPKLSPDATRDVAVALYENQRNGNAATLPPRVQRLTELAPGIAADAVDTQRRRTEYLFNHLPGNISTQQSRLLGLERLRSATKPELNKFARRVEAVSDPYVLFDGVRNNALSMDIVDSAAVGYPAILDAVRKAAEEELLSRKGEIPMTVRRTIRILGGGNISTLSEPGVVVTLQQTYSNGFQTMPQANGRPKAPNVTTSDYVASQADAVSARISGEGPG